MRTPIARKGLTALLLALLAAAVGALVCSGRWRDVPRLWPALAVAAPWQVLRAVHSLSTDLLAGPLQDRIVANQLCFTQDVADGLCWLRTHAQPMLGAFFIEANRGRISEWIVESDDFDELAISR